MTFLLSTKSIGQLSQYFFNVAFNVANVIMSVITLSII
ncbi:hypothetical protein AO380_0493 [Moraxella catarrhalis]|nr:hypothetical protein AO380_0493 [Moraxella catarrhalis]